MKNIPAVRELAEVFSIWAGKFKFGTTPRQVWLQKYQFSKSGHTFENDRVVNSDKAAVRAYVDHLKVAAKTSNPCILMLVGPTGAGKSTFNKMVTTLYHDELKAAGIVASRVEFQKLKEHVDLQDGKPLAKTIGTYVFATVLRDIAFYIYARESVDEAGGPFVIDGMSKLPVEILGRDEFGGADFSEISDRMEEILRDPFYSGLDISGPDIETFFYHFNRYAKMDALDRSGVVPFWANFVLSEIPANRRVAAVAEAFVRVMARRMRPVVIFDGFDYIGVNDFQDDKSLRLMLNWLSRTIVSGQGLQFPISNLRLGEVMQITIRESTNQLFWRECYASHQQVHHEVLRVEAPAIESVIEGLDNMVASQVPDSLHIRPILNEMLNGSVLNLHKRLRRPDVDAIHDFDPCDLFQQNSRHLINFIRDYLEIELYEARQTLNNNKVPMTSRSLALELAAQYSHIAEHSSYVLVQILLSSRSTRYRNFVAFDLTENGEVRLRDNDNESGYVGNVFNYHASYESERGLREFTHKLHILSYLCGTRKRHSLDDVADHIGFDVEFTRVALGFMIRENMVEAWFNGSDTSVMYAASKLGDILFHHLIYELSYVEAVFFGANIPKVFLDTALQDVSRGDGVKRWVHGSVANVITLLRMMATAEDAARKSDGTGALAGVISGMVDRLSSSFSRIARRDHSQGAVLTADDVDRILSQQVGSMG